MVDPEDRTNSHPSSPNVTSSQSTGESSGTSAGNNSSRQSEAKQKGRETVDEVRNAARMKAEGMFDEQKWVFADHAERMSTVFRNMAKGFEEQDQRYFSVYANNIARCTDALSQRLREQDLNSLVNQIQRYSQRQPAVFLGGAIAVGFVLARFLNSSQERSAGNASQADNPAASRTGANTANGALDTSDS